MKRKAAEALDRLQVVDGKSQSLIKTSEQDLEGFRTRMVELERDLKERDERIVSLESRIVELSTEVADKDYEIKFYSDSIEDLQNEVNLLRQGGAQPKAAGATQPSLTGDALAQEVDNWKKKCKILQLNEAKYLEEIEGLKAQKMAEDKDRAVTNILNRNRSKSKTRDQEIAENDGIE
jgi:chromosome segregation ATPase